MRIKLSDAAIRQLRPPKSGSATYFDTVLKGGFVCRITAGGVRSFVLRYRNRRGVERLIKIGRFPDWTTMAARNEARRLKYLVDQGADPAADREGEREAPTVSDLCDRFIADYLPRKRPSTQKSYSQQIEGEIRPALARLKIADVTFSDIDKLHRRISKRAPYRANRVVALLSRMFTMAIRWEMRTDNPCKSVERNQEHKRRRYLTGDELARLTSALAIHKDQQAADIIRLLMLTGARRGETLSACWADFDLDTGVWNKPGATTKQKTEHQVPLSDAARKLLVDLRERSAGAAEYLFPWRDEPHRTDVQDSWEGICAAAKIKNARLHDLRHTYASVLASAGLSLPIIGALLGHTTPTTTARYAHLFDDPLRAAAQRAGEIITGKPSGDVVPLRRG